MIARTSIVFTALCTLSSAAVRSGHATAEWIAGSENYQAGTPVRTALRLVLDEGWHTYWSNPGEGGMKISVKWDLPEGWEAGELEQPVPIRFLTGSLAGFGYEGTVSFPVAITPPAGAAGDVKLAAKVSWLTCDDSACVPGDAELSLELKQGEAAPSSHEAAIREAELAVPRQADGLSLEVTETEAGVELALTAGADFQADPETCEVFPETPQALDPAAPIQFEKSGDGWKAVVLKNEYASGPLKSLTLVFAGKEAVSPFFVTWEGE